MKNKFTKIPLHVHDFQKLKLLLEELVQDKIELIESFSKYALIISSKESMVTINLRSEFFPDLHLAITAISIIPSNQGKGSIVLEWFKKFAKEKSFERLVLQEIVTEEGYYFALKNYFQEMFKKASRFEGNYELHLT